MIGSSKLYNDGKLVRLSELTYNEHKQFEISIKKAIARSMDKKVIRVIEK